MCKIDAKYIGEFWAIIHLFILFRAKVENIAWFNGGS
jgi:hypothetical protein